MIKDRIATPGLRTRYKVLYIASVLAMAALLCVFAGIVLTLRTEPEQSHEGLLALSHLCMAAGILVLGGQALLILKQVVPLLGRDAARADELARELERRTVLDPLTRAYNRAKFEDVATRELDHVRRYGPALSGIMLDVDGLRDINRAHGDRAGDRVLADLARGLDAQLRSNDFLFRWHGGKFIVLCPHTDIDKAAVVAEKMRILAGHKLFGGKIRMSLSLGVALAEADDTAESFRQRLQSGLTSAKNGGRNQVAVFRPPTPKR
ncbi:GGDEF domain-containing protein [Pseudodesulfovibrio thermohalotolerans]|uniref:GGDEF domain-containing protein n=1 Tax=Pseudodesulfovibrio thermohalotolerans TaxID=2880651 RepID=UPI002442F082|nr:GGDEF domain-containing protein [Pseudodesulfovibrio thermohalotolerans]WFS62538.1 GGDEF domain-containing protein [Pseudodesulfovibrio thermohalotolerans]